MSFWIAVPRDNHVPHKLEFKAGTMHIYHAVFRTKCAACNREMMEDPIVWHDVEHGQFTFHCWRCAP